MKVEILNKLKIYADAFNQIRDLLNERERQIFLQKQLSDLDMVP